MEYKGYIGQVEFDEDANLFHGEIISIKDVVTFQGKSVKELKKSFKDSVDDYLDFCLERGESPDKPFSGKFIIRISPEEHRKIYIASKKRRRSVNSWVKEILEKATSEI